MEKQFYIRIHPMKEKTLKAEGYIKMLVMKEVRDINESRCRRK